ncbi:MAG: glycosyltransferase [Candidatus Bipolaricaulota bacterium]|nr:glycosyltransferase [Candidatus Bipolaricaulota bacterium]
MRVLIVTTFPSAESGGGMGRAAHELARELARTHEVLLLCPGEETALEGGRPGEPRILRVAAGREGDVVLPDLRVERLLRRRLDRFNPHVVHAQDFGILALWAQDWARRTGRPFLATLHCLPSQAHAFTSAEKGAFTRIMGRSPLFRLFLHVFLERCDGVIALNGAMEADLRRFGYRGPVYRVPNGRNLCAYQALSFADPREPEKRLLFVGSFARRKNQGYLIEVMSHLRVPARLELVGGALEPGYLAEVQEKVQALGLSTVEVVGPVPYGEIPRRLERAHLFVSASRLEVQSLAVIEALAAGTPVVGLANATIDELVDDRVGKRLSPDASPAEFAREVERICALPPEAYERMCRAARERVRPLDWESVVERTTNVYRELALARARRRPAFWSPWLVTASAVRYSFRDLARPKRARRLSRAPRQA